MLIALTGSFRQAFVDEQFEFDRYPGPQAGERLRLLVHDLVDERLIVQTLERPLSANHFVEYAPQRPNIGPVIDLRPLGLLGRHVGNGAERHIELGKL